VRRAIIARAMQAPVELAQRIGGTLRRIIDALDAPRPSNALARHQLAAIRQKVTELERELEVRDDAGLVADDIVATAAKTLRSLHQIDDDATHRAARLAMGLDVAAHLAVHGSATLPPEARHGDEDAFAAVVRAFGVGQAALAHFALMYPDLAVRIDRPSLDRLVIAWTTEVQGGKWPVLASVWWEVFDVRLAPLSIKNETTKLRRAELAKLSR
jgi:hypothetical protein